MTLTMVLLFDLQKFYAMMIVPLRILSLHFYLHQYTSPFRKHLLGMLMLNKLVNYIAPSSPVHMQTLIGIPFSFTVFLSSFSS